MNDATLNTTGCCCCCCCYCCCCCCCCNDDDDDGDDGNDYVDDYDDYVDDYDDDYDLHTYIPTNLLPLRTHHETLAMGFKKVQAGQVHCLQGRMRWSGTFTSSSPSSK